MDSASEARRKIFERVASEAQRKAPARPSPGPKEHIVIALTEAVRETNAQRILETARAAGPDPRPPSEAQPTAGAEAPFEEKSEPDDA